MTDKKKLSFQRKLWEILTPRERRGALKLLMLMFVGTGLETLGVGLIIPALALLTQPDYSAKYPKLQRLLQAFGNPSTSAVIASVMMMLVATYVVKALFLSFVAWRQTKFAYGVQQNLSQRLFTVYMHQPYVFFLQRNSAQLLQNVTSEIGRFTGYTIIPCVNFISEGLVFTGLAMLLLVVEPMGAIIVGSVLGGVGWVFQYFIRGRVLQWGKMRHHHEAVRAQHVQQGLGGAKDVKLLGREAEFLELFRIHNVQSAKMVQLEQTLAALPRLGLELLAVVSLAALVLGMLGEGRSAGVILPTLGLFAGAAFRVLPSVTRMLSCMQQLNYGMPVVDTLYNELHTLSLGPKPSQSPHRQFGQTLELKGISYSYPGRDQPALDGISLTVRRGESVGFIGSSGAGKSTLVDILLGLLTPDNGNVCVDGSDIQSSMRSWQDQIGYVPQSIYLTDDSLRRNVAFCLPEREIDEAAVFRALHAAQLDEFVAALPEGIETKVGERGVRLSGGQRQRIGLARALYHDPGVLVLDEATGALDTTTEHNVMEAVRSLQGAKTVIIVAHRYSTVERCDRLFRLEKGRIVDEGTYAELVRPTLSTNA